MNPSTSAIFPEKIGGFATCIFGSPAGCAGKLNTALAGIFTTGGGALGAVVKLFTCADKYAIACVCCCMNANICAIVICGCCLGFCCPNSLAISLMFCWCPGGGP